MDNVILEGLIAQGQTLRMIAKSQSTSATNVRHWLQKYGLRTRRGPKGKLRPEDVADRRCTCGETDPEKFHGVKRHKCAKCQNRYNHDKARATRKRAIALLGGKCSRCPYDRCQAALDIHHLDPSQKDPGFQYMRGWTWSKVETELRKCILVCRNCHAELHEEMRHRDGV